MIFLPVKEEDIEEIRNIYIYYIRNTTVTFHKHDVSHEEMRNLLIFDNPKYVSYAIWDENVICGYCILTQYKVREAFDLSAEITIYLKHGYEQRGIGSQAVKFIEKIAKSNNIHVIVALICGENTGSIKLFEKCGYTKCAHYMEIGYKFKRWLDLVCYQKIIDYSN